jgi:hypothetical protein
MAPLSFAERVVRLEKQMTALQHLPKKVDDLALQVSQLHSEMTGEFSAIRREMAEQSVAFQAEMEAQSTRFRAEFVAQFRAEMDAQSAALRAEMTIARDEVAAEFAAVRAEMSEGFTAPTGALARAVAGLRDEIRAGDEETRRQMRVLHEDLVTRIALLSEGLSPAKPPRTKRRPRDRR